MPPLDEGSYLYMQFRSVITMTFVFAGILVAWSGGFLMLWFYGQPWFLNFDVFGANMQTLFQIFPINLSIAIWVGLLALFGIASNDSVVITTYLDQSFDRSRATPPQVAWPMAMLTAADGPGWRNADGPPAGG